MQKHVWKQPPTRKAQQNSQISGCFAMLIEASVDREYEHGQHAHQGCGNRGSERKGRHSHRGETALRGKWIEFF